MLDQRAGWPKGRAGWLAMGKGKKGKEKGRAFSFYIWEGKDRQKGQGKGRIGQRLRPEPMP